ncbi:lipoprotein LpqQ [Mycobacterium tuberculosis KT-0028]|nr:lipoprotein LpqQ [Mycobacterium tuberculosis KT-0028]
MWRALASVAISRVLLHCCQVGRHRLLCGHRDHGMLVSSTSTQPSTAPPTSRVDSLIVSIEDVRRIANYEELAAHFQTDLREPPEADTNVPGPCRVVGSSDRTFGTDWSEFRSAGYHGVTDDLRPGGPVMVETVSQAIALYPDPSTARGVFHRLESSLAECAGLHDPYFDFILDRPDASTVRIGAAGWSHVYRLKSSVFISVGVLGIEPAEPIANVILQTISDRIQ